MEIFDSRRILTVHEMTEGQILHGGMLAGKCVEWRIIAKFPQHAIMQVGTTNAIATGKNLREFAFYPANDCPVCELNYEVKPSAIPELHAIPREILAADIPSSFRFRAAQYGREIKKRN
jgi:hypothetical protein